MTHTPPAAEQRHIARVPLLLGVLLLIALIVASYLIYSWIYAPATLEYEHNLTMEQERSATLAAKKAQLEAILQQNPCAAQELLKDFVVPMLPVSPATPHTPPSETQTTPTTPPAVQDTSTGKNPADPVALLENACVFIICSDSKGNISTGSGFFVAPGYVATNRHVIKNATGRILVTSRAMKNPAFGQLVHHSQEDERDYALLKVETPEGLHIGIPSFAPAAHRTEKVGAWGFPHVVGQNDPAYAKLLSGNDLSAVPELVYSEGVVSAVLERTPPLVVHTAPISPGNSGGPLVNAKGEIVGINTMITLDEDSYRQASIALAGADLLHFLQSCGVQVRSNTR